MLHQIKHTYIHRICFR